MMSLTKMGLDPGPLVHVLFLFVLMNQLVVLGSVGGVSGVGSGVCVPTGIESIGDVVPLFVFVPKVFESKSGRLIEIFCRQKY